MKDFSVEAVANGSVRLDLTDPEPHDPLLARFCRVIDLNTARMFTIMLIDAIEKAEYEEARARTKKGKRK